MTCDHCLLSMPTYLNLGRPSLRTFIVPRTNRQFGDRAFSVTAPRAWNRLPVVLKLSRSITAFKRNLKTFLYTAVWARNWITIYCRRRTGNSVCIVCALHLFAQVFLPNCPFRCVWAVKLPLRNYRFWVHVCDRDDISSWHGQVNSLLQDSGVFQLVWLSK